MRSISGAMFTLSAIAAASIGSCRALSLPSSDGTSERKYAAASVAGTVPRSVAPLDALDHVPATRVRTLTTRCPSTISVTRASPRSHRMSDQPPYDSMFVEKYIDRPIATPSRPSPHTLPRVAYVTRTSPSGAAATRRAMLDPVWAPRAGAAAKTAASVKLATGTRRIALTVGC